MFSHTIQKVFNKKRLFNILHLESDFLVFYDKSGGNAIQTAIVSMRKEQLIKVGDKVTFDNDQIEAFKAETDLDNNEIRRYRKLVLAGIDQIGDVKDVGITMATILYPDGWELPVPIKYLLVLPRLEE